ncbi:MAG TPA: cystathionine beta-lyase [Steroidobacteraceae bacterium]|jgi:cystathionine beta-lyase|nr:cystathionine beta-lyase [Steroidobacteraceae bacterium]
MHWRSKLIHPSAHAPAHYRSLATPTYRGSTVVFERQADVSEDWRQTESGYTYGLYGTPTVLELGARIAEIEGARHSFVVPGGQAAISLIYLAFCNAGTHALVPFSAYGPNRELAAGLMRRLGVSVESYDPLIGAGIADAIRENTALIWVESPGSVTMEIQDVPAIVAAARARKVPVALDNTYAAGVLFDAFAHGVDVSMQALTKYVGGHSDLLLGTVSVAEAGAYEAIGSALKQLGMAVSPDDCSLALRGLQTLGVRLERLEKSTLEVARWLAKHPAVRTVLHPALESCPGHEYWRRDFTGSSSIFSIILDERFTAKQANAFADGLKLFKIGFSWGGVTSLVVVYPNLDRPGKSRGGRLVRLNVGLEEPSDLIIDLSQALNIMGSPA